MNNIIRRSVKDIIYRLYRLKSRLKKRTRILFYGLNIMNYNMFKDLYNEIKMNYDVDTFICIYDYDANKTYYANLDIDRKDVIELDDISNFLGDAIIEADFLPRWTKWPIRRIQIFHGVASKLYKYNNELGEIVINDYRYHHNMPAYDNVFFINKLDYEESIERNILKHRNGAYVVGMTCLDEMIKDSGEGRLTFLKNMYIPKEYQDKKVLTYAPTWGENSSFQNIGNIIIDKLANIDAFIVFKPHPLCITNNVCGSKYNLKEYIEYKFNRDNWCIVTDTPYKIMPVSDIMITDFGSIAFEFSLLKRPIFLYEGSKQQMIIGDKEQYNDIRNCAMMFNRANVELMDFKNGYDIRGDRLQSYKIIREKYFSNVGSSIGVALRILEDNKVIFKKDGRISNR